MPPKKAAAAAKADTTEAAKPKAKASKRARDTDDDAKAAADAEPVPTTNQNTALIAGLETLAFYEFNYGDKFAALAHLKCAAILAKCFFKKLEASKDIPYNFGEAAGADRSEYIGRGHRHLIDEFLAEGKGTFSRLEALQADNPTTSSTTIDDALRAQIMATEVTGTPPTKAVLAKIAAEVTNNQSSTVDALKAMLRSNRQPVSGVKAELVRRVSEGVVLGALPPCPQCFGGKLKYDIETGVITCNGFMDDDEYTFCYYRAADAERGAWQ